MSGSSGGYLKFAKTMGTASKTGVVIAASKVVLNMSSDVCQMSAAGTLWGFRDMGTQWNVLGVDLTPNSRTTIYYVVGDDTAESQEYMFQVPPAPGSTDEIEILACERLPSSRQHCTTFFVCLFMLILASYLSMNLSAHGS